MSIAISEMTEGLNNLENSHQIMPPSPDHLVNRKELLERMGINSSSNTALNGSNNNKHRSQHLPRYDKSR